MTDRSSAGRRVVFFGSYDVHRHPRVAVLRDGLAARGNQVVEVNRPLGLSTADKVHAASSLAGSLRMLVAMCRAWWGLWCASKAEREPDLVVVGYLGHFDVHLARLRWPKATIALDHLVGLADSARDRRVASGLKFRLLELLDRAALRRADVVVVDTTEQRDELPGWARARAVVVPVGASDEWYRQAPPPPPPPLRACFVGLFTPLHGAPLIGRAIARLADDPRIRFTMVGSGQDLAETKAAAGGAEVDWIDWVAADDLPALVASQHVCLGIFGTTPKAQRVVPTKVFQGLAAGNVVVTSDTEPQRRMLGEAALFVPAGDDAALAAQLSALADDLEAAAPDPAARKAAADRFRPDEVVVPLEARWLGPRRTRDLGDGPALPANAWLRFDLLRRTLEEIPPGRVLEVGPGRGAVAARLVAAGHDYTGVEMSAGAREATADVLSATGEGRSRLVASLDDLAPDETFDLVCAFEVLEHIEDDVGALGEWAARLRPGGHLLLSVPAWPERFSTHDEEVGHLRRYSPEDLGRVAAAAGLVDVDVRAYGFPLGYPLEHARNAISVVLQRRRAARPEPGPGESTKERTERSGSWFQPPRAMNGAIRAATWPFRVVQRRFPGRGTGLVMVGRAPGR